ncbi:acetyl-CoA carboxylase biotin carboxylase subunit [Blattabacterium cuenoti]|uniref:acetyl-CoA carboxylase biotin carboxylase subunit n=1 Tax=Blattabacterium cuenoti TaxID=1653831 RepID=UPI00163B78DD|nr:acetyl-CoA carboxylase biotin carboxylase subunit [Blattabacterium cuenoti]
MFNKILIANRGEIALRIIRTAKEIGIQTVAVYSTEDKHSLHVYFADEAVCIGPSDPYQSYLNIPNLISAAEITNADAIHPGYGFLSEDPYFSSMCEKHRIIFIGAKPHHMVQMGNKILAKQTMYNAGIPCIPGSLCLKGLSFIEIEKQADEIGYPIVIKSVFGGGGRGIRSVLQKNQLKSSLEDAKKESYACFGKEDIYIEKYLLDPRHIEIQIISDKYGNVRYFYERDCSIQRRNQKLIEETPSPFLNSSLRKRMGDQSIKAIQYMRYEGVGTIEFLVDEKKNFYFMEMNPRIQVEHTITEEITGLDLIKEQIFIAYGKKIYKKKIIHNQMHSIECRINAENPLKNFQPISGTITKLHLPGGKGVRIDTHIYSGYGVSHYYDSMIAKLIATSNNRKETIEKMKRALEEFVIEGIPTTIPFYSRIMSYHDFVIGDYNINFLQEKNLNFFLYNH